MDGGDNVAGAAFRFATGMNSSCFDSHMVSQVRVRGPSLRSGFRLRAHARRSPSLTPAERLKFATGMDSSGLNSHDRSGYTNPRALSRGTAQPWRGIFGPVSGLVNSVQSTTVSLRSRRREIGSAQSPAGADPSAAPQDYTPVPIQDFNRRCLFPTEVCSRRAENFLAE